MKRIKEVIALIIIASLVAVVTPFLVPVAFVAAVLVCVCKHIHGNTDTPSPCSIFINDPELQADIDRCNTIIKETQAHIAHTDMVIANTRARIDSTEGLLTDYARAMVAYKYMELRMYSREQAHAQALIVDAHIQALQYNRVLDAHIEALTIEEQRNTYMVHMNKKDSYHAWLDAILIAEQEMHKYDHYEALTQCTHIGMNKQAHTRSYNSMGDQLRIHEWTDYPRRGKRNHSRISKQGKARRIKPVYKRYPQEDMDYAL